MKLTVRQLKNIIKEVVQETPYRGFKPLRLAADDYDYDHDPKSPPGNIKGDPFLEKEWHEKQERYSDVFDYGDVPMDYEECGYCGYDHEYDPDLAREWHEENDPEGELYK